MALHANSVSCAANNSTFETNKPVAWLDKNYFGGLFGVKAFKWGASPETEWTLLQYSDTQDKIRTSSKNTLKVLCLHDYYYMHDS